MTVLDTIPDSVEMGLAETIPWGIQTAPLFKDLDIGTVPTAPVVTVTNEATGAVVALATAPVVTGTVVIQKIIGPTDLVKAGLYRLNLVVTASPSGAVLQTGFQIAVLA